MGSPIMTYKCSEVSLSCQQFSPFRRFQDKCNEQRHSYIQQTWPEPYHFRRYSSQCIMPNATFQIHEANQFHKRALTSSQILRLLKWIKYNFGWGESQTALGKITTLSRSPNRTGGRGEILPPVSSSSTPSASWTWAVPIIETIQCPLQRIMSPAI